VTQDKQAQAAMDFEQALSELETLVERMERGELSLEDSLEHYERGVALGRACQRALDRAEQRIRVLGEREGDETLTDFASEAGEAGEDDEDGS
jgi:exodeoxyribonuclease VII small subunit